LIFPAHEPVAATKFLGKRNFEAQLFPARGVTGSERK